MGNGGEDMNNWRIIEVLGPLALTVVVAVVGGMFTIFQHCSNQNRFEQEQVRLKQEKDNAKISLAQEKKYEIEKLKGDRLTTLLKHFASKDCSEQLMAMKASENLNAKEQFPDEILPVIAQIYSDENKCPKVKEAAKTFITEVANRTSENPEKNVAAINALEKVDPEEAKEIPSRVYLNVPEGTSLKQAELLKKALEKENLVVAKIKKGGESPVENDLRYFMDGKNQEEDLKKINQVLKANNIFTIKTDLKDKYPSSEVRPRHYEIWLKSDDDKKEITKNSISSQNINVPEK